MSLLNHKELPVYFPFKTYESDYLDILTDLFELYDVIVDLNTVNCEYLSMNNKKMYELYFLKYENNPKMYYNIYEKIIQEGERCYIEASLYNKPETKKLNKKEIQALDVYKRVAYEIYYVDKLDNIIKYKVDIKAQDNVIKKLLRNTSINIVGNTSMDSILLIETIIERTKEHSKRTKTLIYIDMLDIPNASLYYTFIKDFIKECECGIVLKLHHDYVYEDYFKDNILYDENGLLLVGKVKEEIKRDNKGIIN